MGPNFIRYDSQLEAQYQGGSAKHYWRYIQAGSRSTQLYSVYFSIQIYSLVYGVTKLLSVWQSCSRREQEADWDIRPEGHHGGRGKVTQICRLTHNTHCQSHSHLSCLNCHGSRVGEKFLIWGRSFKRNFNTKKFLIPVKKGAWEAIKYPMTIQLGFEIIPAGVGTMNSLLRPVGSESHLQFPECTLRQRKYVSIGDSRRLEYTVVRFPLNYAWFWDIKVIWIRFFVGLQNSHNSTKLTNAQWRRTMCPP